MVKLMTAQSSRTHFSKCLSVTVGKRKSLLEIISNSFNQTQNETLIFLYSTVKTCFMLLDSRCSQFTMLIQILKRLAENCHRQLKTVSIHQALDNRQCIDLKRETKVALTLGEGRRGRGEKEVFYHQRIKTDLANNALSSMLMFNKRKLNIKRQDLKTHDLA